MQQVVTGRIRGNGSATTATSETASAIPNRESYSPPGKSSDHSTTLTTVHSNSSAMSESSPTLRLRPNNLPATCIHSKIPPNAFQHVTYMCAFNIGATLQGQGCSVSSSTSNATKHHASPRPSHAN